MGVSTTPRPPLPSLQYAVKQLEQAIRAQLDTLLKPSGVTAVQYTALSVLERRPATTSADLARASFTRAQSTADLVTALERRGLISRQADPLHKRRLLISLTEAGRQFLDRYAPDVAALEERMVADLDADQRQELRHLLDLCRRALTLTGSASPAR